LAASGLTVSVDDVCLISARRISAHGSVKGQFVIGVNSASLRLVIGLEIVSLDFFVIRFARKRSPKEAINVLPTLRNSKQTGAEILPRLRTVAAGGALGDRREG
jgi:hypothetical protein